MTGDPGQVLAGLKPFQLATVEYACERFRAGCSRFLVADEVGLGKTKVANGILAKLLADLPDRSRADILYVCSNGAIARKNLKVLDAAGAARQEATRLTLLPLLLEDGGACGRGVNLLSLTPGTSFDPASSMGWARERALIRNALAGNRAGPSRFDKLLRGQARTSWGHQVENARFKDGDRVIKAFLGRINSSGLLGECAAASRRGEGDGGNLRLVGRLRHELALASIESLRPALIIFDEFQRFSDLFGHGGDVVPYSRQWVARSLMDAFLKHERGPRGAKVLFLSATPYRMLTLRQDDPLEGDHRREFLKVVEVLYGPAEGPKVAAGLEDDFQALRRALRERLSGTAAGTLAPARDLVEAKLRNVISRTERVDPSRPDAGISRQVVVTPVTGQDLRQARAANAVARRVDAPGVVEYWKSSPYLFSFMGNYKLAEKARASASGELARLARPAMLPMARVRQGAPIDLGNGRMRLLARQVLDEAGLHRRLWLPPSLEYVSGGPSGLTKTLIFSAWQLAPEAIAGLVSYEAERRARSEAGMPPASPPKHAQLLRFQASDDHIEASRRAMVLVHPSRFLAEVVDPMATWKERGKLSPRDLIEVAKEAIKSAWPKELADPGTDAPWELVVQLDALHGAGEDVASVRSRLAPRHRVGSGWADVYQSFSTAREAPAGGEATPSDGTLEYLARVALGSPAVCARRSLARYLSGPVAADAAQVADAFVSLFNKREVAPLLALRRGAAWSSALDLCIEDDLQAVLDEYIYLLTGGMDLDGAARAELVDTASSVIGLRNSPITVHDPFRKASGRRQREATLPAHVAVRFAANVIRDEDDGAAGGVHRIDALMDAFNSPFRPFVLASTSVGQEGLDFHRYCHRLWHWNLPSNPVDLEQREGRIQRFLGHAVRLNLASEFGDIAGKAAGLSPWAGIMALATKLEQTQGGAPGPGGMTPFWLFDGKAKVESVIPVPPLSRDGELAERVQRSAATYRLVFGQARQDDLVRVIGQLDPAGLDAVLDEGLICLRPPALE